MDKRIGKLWYIHAREYDSAMENEGIPPFATTKRDLKVIMLNDIGQTEKDTQGMISLMWGI